MTIASGYTETLRKLADLLDVYPKMDEPSNIYAGELVWNFWDADAKEKMAGHRRVLGGKWLKNEPVDDFNETYYKLTSTWNGVAVELCAYRKAVCEAVVVGTETVTKKVPTAFKEQEVEQDVIEWRCAPLLDAS